MRPEAAGSNPRLQIAIQHPSTLRDGQLVQARVVKALTTTKWLLAIGGRVYPATSEVPVRIGDILTARVHFDAGRIFLQLTREAEAVQQTATVLQRMGLPHDDRGAQLLRAFMREGLPVDPARFSRLHRSATRLGVEQAHDLRLLVVLDRKGLSEFTDLWLALQQAISGARERDPDDHRKRRQHPGAGGMRGKPGESEDVERIATELRSLFGRAGGKAEHPLQLFNHFNRHSKDRGTDEGHWVIVPLALTRGAIQYNGSARLRLNRLGGFSRAVVALTGAGRRWAVEWWNTGASGARVAVYADDTQLVQLENPNENAAWRALSERLRSYGISELCLSSFPEHFDGFSSDGADYIIRTVRKDL